MEEKKDVQEVFHT